MAKKAKKKDKPSVDREDFIAFISSMTPAEINKLIEEQGKPPKLIEPLFFLPSKQ